MNYAQNMEAEKPGVGPKVISRAGKFFLFGPYRFSLESSELFTGKKKVPLKVQSAKVLGILLENQGQLVSRDHLIREIWPDRTVEFDLSLNSCLRDIRQALVENPRAPKFIETLPKRGYRFSAEVNLVTSSSPMRFAHSLMSPRGLAMGLGLVLIVGLLVGSKVFAPEILKTPPPAAVTEEARALVLSGVSAIYDNEVPRTEEALSLFNQAIDVDPTYTEAHLMIARTLFARGVVNDGDQVQTALENVLALDPLHLEATAMIGNLKWTIFHDFEGAKESFQQVLVLDPQNAGAYLALARIFALEGNFDKSLSQVDLALSVNTINLTQSGSVGWDDYLAGRYEEGLKFCQETKAVNPEEVGTQRCFLNNLIALGRFEEAAPYALSYLAASGVPNESLANKTPDEVLNFFYRFEQTNGPEEGSRFDPSNIYQAMALTSDGNLAAALEVLTKAYEDRNYFVPLIGVIPAFEPLKKEAGFETLVRAMNLPLLSTNS